MAKISLHVPKCRDIVAEFWEKFTILIIQKLKDGGTWSVIHNLDKLAGLPESSASEDQVRTYFF